ncbi:MAG: GNAT family N-acetyltransferase [Thermoactinospora sp.]|nr:GNAT family N-acetyltransferase [Thermoactinospora sp.]
MLREATEKDLGALRRWRNDPEVRKASFTTHEIGESEHRRWWEAVRADSGRRVLVYEHTGVPVGAVLFKDHDPVRRSVYWGFYLDHTGLAQSGALMAAWVGMERAAVRYAFDELSVELLTGEVLEWNRPVRWMHRRCGFAETERRTIEIDGRHQEIIVIEQRSSHEGRPSREG